MTTGPVSPDVVSNIFSAALGREDLSELSALIGQWVGADAIVIFIADRHGIFDISLLGPLKQTQAPYLAHYNRLDIWNRNLQRMPAGRIALAYEHTPERELVKTEFYNDFAQHIGLFRPMGARLLLGSETVANIGLERAWSKRLFEEEDKVRLAPLMPFIQSALLLRIRQRQGRLPPDVSSAALDALAFGAVICTAEGKVVLANAAAEALARSGAGVILGDHRGIRAHRPEDTRSLRSLIHDAATGGPGGGRRLAGADGIAVLLTLVTPLPATLIGHRPGHAMVALRSIRDSVAFKEKTLSALFTLSPAQASIALALINGRTPEEIAAARGVSITTVRTQMQEIFVRTGAENQRALTRLLGMLPPLR